MSVPVTVSGPDHALEADTWTVGGVELSSRVLLGTSRYPSLQALLDSIDASRAQVATVSVRRNPTAGIGAPSFTATSQRSRRPRNSGPTAAAQHRRQFGRRHLGFSPRPSGTTSPSGLQ